MSLRFTVTHRDTATAARCGVLETPHGNVQTPAFMPVGTYGAVKGMRAEILALLAEDPPDGVGDVALAAPVRAHDGGHPRGDLQRGLLGETLKAHQLNTFQVQGIPLRLPAKAVLRNDNSPH